MKPKKKKVTSKNKKDLWLYKLTDNGNFRYYRLACIILFMITAFGLIYFKKDFFRWVESISIFIPTQSFFIQNLQLPGVLLTYTGTFFTQFFYYPYLGGILFILIQLLISGLVLKTFKVPRQYFPLAFIPSILLLLSATQAGYVLYTLKSPGFIFSNSIGVIFSLTIFLLYKKIKPGYARILFATLFIIVTYPLLGVYSLFTALLYSVYEVIFFTKDKKKYHLSIVVISLVSTILIPAFCYYYIYTQMQWDDVYTIGLPKYYFEKEFQLWFPFIILFLSLFLYLIFIFKDFYRQKKWTPLLSFTVFIAYLAIACKYTNHDKNFETELAMNYAIEMNDWEKVIEIGNNIKTDPTRLIIMNYNLALYKRGKAGDKMFHINHNSVQPQSSRTNLILMHMGAKHIYFQYGKINFCYRWCMEDMVEYGMSVSRLKYMVKCAILNQEYALAQKYNNILKKTLFYKKWANRYQKYIDNPQLAEQDIEFKAIQPLMAYDNQLDGDCSLLELYVLNNFAYMQGGSPELVELSIQCNLILKNIERFWPRFFLYARTHDRIPVHYQEAAILYSYLEKKVDVSKFNIEKQTVDRFNQLITMSQRSMYNSEEKNRELFKPQFGNTFWYYYFFLKDVKTNE